MKNAILSTLLLLITLNALNAQLAFVNNGQRVNRDYGTYVSLDDLNNDGFLDALVTNQDNYRIYFGDGNGLFENSSQSITKSTSFFGKPATGDLNGDGFPDIVHGKTIWLNDGAGYFTATTNLIESSASDDLDQPKLIDLNNDGALDLISIANVNSLRVFFNDGTGHFTDSGQMLLDDILQGSLLAQIALSDVNGDGNTDIVCAGWKWNDSPVCPNRILFGDSLGNFQDSGQLLDEGASHVHGMALGDLNNDGLPEIVMAFGGNTRAGRIYWNDGTGQFTAGPDIAGSAGWGVAISDFDGDGLQDIFIAQSVAPNRIWLNNGNGEFEDGDVRFASYSYLDAAAGDFNADGKTDLFAVCQGNSAPAYAQIWLNSTTAAVNNEIQTPVQFQLEQNFPNPFNPSTHIQYSLAAQSRVQLSVFNTLGQKIKTLVNSFQNPGDHSIVWDGTDASNNPVSTGIYFYQMKAENQTLQKKMLLVQ